MEVKILQLDHVVNSGVTSPELIDYDQLGLYKRKTSGKGVVTRCEYFRNFDGENYSDLIVDVRFVYEFDEINRIYTGQTTTVNWLNTADEIAYTRIFAKTFLDWEKIDFGITKRNNIISTAKLYVLSQIGLTDGLDLLNAMGAAVDKYINGSTQPLIDKLNEQVGLKFYLNQEFIDNVIAIITDL